MGTGGGGRASAQTLAALCARLLTCSSLRGPACWLRWLARHKQPGNPQSSVYP